MLIVRSPGAPLPQIRIWCNIGDAIRPPTYMISVKPHSRYGFDTASRIPPFGLELSGSSYWHECGWMIRPDEATCFTSGLMGVRAFVDEMAADSVIDLSYRASGSIHEDRFTTKGMAPLIEKVLGACDSDARRSRPSRSR
jgi:hypothetical protein